MKREKIQTNKITNEIGDITTDITKIQRITTGFYEQLYVNKLDSLAEMKKFLEA